MHNRDSLGLDYWLESSLPTEGGLGLHQKICVGKPNTSNRMCISFGDTQDGCLFFCKGEVYDNTFPTPVGPAPLYGRGFNSYSSRFVDDQIKKEMISIIGQKGTYSLIGSSCRDFSQTLYAYFHAKYGSLSKPAN